KLANYWDRIIRARVELEVDKNKRGGLIHSATVTLEVPGPDIRVQEEAGDMHAAIDLTMPVLERQIKKAKNKLERTDWRHMDKAREKFRQWYERMRGNK
ncbi:MAG TPA: ribosome-associated translation inhibitor RaiA, partial [Candidatus Veblenbacteria bacterium]|nr:ribosome-associated translation inhibitor RaiA [Candidatus Veblenbacteria bacterium]